jgi:hypothetical protein
VVYVENRYATKDKPPMVSSQVVEPMPMSGVKVLKNIEAAKVILIKSFYFN